MAAQRGFECEPYGSDACYREAAGRMAGLRDAGLTGPCRFCGAKDTTTRVISASGSHGVS